MEVEGLVGLSFGDALVVFRFVSDLNWELDSNHLFYVRTVVGSAIAFPQFTVISAVKVL